VAKNGLMKAVRDECGNYVRKECIKLEGGKCRIGEGKRCGWFFEAVLPLYPELREEYLKLDKVKGGEKREEKEEHYQI